MNTKPFVTIELPTYDYVGVARLVAAGVATRLDLPFDAVDDLQLALETVLRSAFASEDRAVIGIASNGLTLSVSVGPVAPSVLKQRLHDRDALGDMDVGAMLGRLVDGVTVETEPLPSIVLHVDLAVAGAA
jgi:hypothetical protein